MANFESNFMSGSENVDVLYGDTFRQTGRPTEPIWNSADRKHVNSRGKLSSSSSHRATEVKKKKIVFTCSD